MHLQGKESKWDCLVNLCVDEEQQPEDEDHEVGCCPEKRDLNQTLAINMQTNVPELFLQDLQSGRCRTASPKCLRLEEASTHLQPGD